MKKIFILIIVGIFLVGTVYAVGEVSYCCEKTVSGAWCQNSEQANCDIGNNCNGQKCKTSPSSCEATSYCKLGCCYDSQDGTCMENTPENVCNEGGGVWSNSAKCEIPQCKLGCCLIGDQAAFVTQIKCKQLSALYGLETNYRTDLTNEIQCISSAMPNVKGACIFEENYQKTCKFTTRKECAEIKSENKTGFYQDTLCSAESLAVNCGPSKKTTCVEGKDEVYFVDTCGNIANIYDASKINSKEYWANIYGKEESCGFGNSNVNSASCGSCDYYLGSTCKDSKFAGTRASYGDYICKDLSCKYDGKTYKHGETWCANNPGSSENLPGSRHFRMVCYNGEVTVEPCADFRQEVCIQSDISGFKTAACRVNMWQDCTIQGNKKDCENKDKRDCKWVNDKCAPLYAPGFNTWEESDAGELCAQASETCVIKYESKLLGSKKCIENCECLGSSWNDIQNKMCISLGDCGSKKNYLGLAGY
ncbi:MAG: hypothetical protein V1672_03305 [Candidatus Diapherotrites archaeon]